MVIICQVKPRSKVDSIQRLPNGHLKVKIKAPPVDGKANEYLIGYLARAMGIKAHQLELITGHTSSVKRINIVADEAAISHWISQLP